MVSPAGIRVGRATALFAKFQSAKETPATSFVVADRVWSAQSEFDPAPEYPLDEWMDASESGKDDAAYEVPEKPLGTLPIKLTPTMADLLLKSNFGPKSGSAFSLDTQVTDSRWLSLVWIENNAAAPSFGRSIRAQDAWFHRLNFIGTGPQDSIIQDMVQRHVLGALRICVIEKYGQVDRSEKIIAYIGFLPFCKTKIRRRVSEARAAGIVPRTEDSF